MTMKLGFIGLGIMGRPMALNLRRAGHALWVHGRRPVTMGTRPKTRPRCGGGSKRPSKPHPCRQKNCPCKSKP